MQRPKNVDQADWNLLQNELQRFQGDGKNALTPQQLENARPEDLGNSVEMEMQWAEKAFQHAEVYFKLLQNVEDHTKLRLTKIDDEIYSHFRTMFPKVEVHAIDEDKLKSEKSKKLWRTFCGEYNDERVKDFNFGTLMRLQSSLDYSQENSTIVPRIQFLAIEIARNREGYNKPIYQQAQAAKGSSSSK